MTHLTRVACACFVSVMGLAACGGSEGDTNNQTPDAAMQSSGTLSKFVNSSLKIGSSEMEADGLAFADLDNKPPAKDNELGALLASFNPQLMLDNALTTAVNAGTIVILHSIRADSLSNDSSATWQVWLGAQQANPKFDGTGTFTVAATSPQDAIITGSISNGKFTGRASQVSLELALSASGNPVRIKIVPAVIEADVTANGLTNGRLAGAISETEMNANVIPAVVVLLDGRVAADAGCREALIDCDMANAILLGLFDADRDRIIELEETRTVLADLIPYDVDVLGANGQPGTDGTAESTSVTLGFGGAKAIYTAPGEN